MKRLKYVAISLFAGVMLMCGCLSLSAFADDSNPDFDASQYNVTVPLYVAMYASNSTGSVMVPDGYGITNYSESDVIVRSVQGFNAGNEDYFMWSLVTDPNVMNAGDLYLTLNGYPLTTDVRNVDWLIPAATPDKPEYLDIPLSARIAGGNVNWKWIGYGARKVCYVVYTIEYKPSKYTVHYSSAHGEVPEDTTAERNIYSYFVPDMNADGYIFVGWNTVQNPTTENPGRWYYANKLDVISEAEVNADPDPFGNPTSVTLYAQWELDYEARLHISSDYLELNGATYNVVDWEDGLEFELYNFQKENVALVSDAGVKYTVTVDGKVTQADQSFGSGVKKITVSTAGKHYGDTVNVVVTATYGTASNSISARFNLTSKDYAEYTVTRNEDGTSLLKIVTNDYSGNITVEYNNVPPDNTNNYMQSWTTAGKKGVISVQPNTIYELLFFGNLEATSGTIPYGSAGTITLS